ncbi:arsenate reductase ArsC [Aestuariivivens sediminis]|uniref:arsenate reductase ArsC n=1 Tax=Aestuariivivens sediminis TaxID=2913557 RepID=UPI001F591DC5|nr:arsenate reductase ArsC [Aestuariivivens sediminis]
MINILVLCTGNSCRSQMAHGYLNQFTDPEKIRVYSAGIETHGINPGAAAIMKEDGISIDHHTSNHVDEYAHVNFDYIVTVCDHANENCPYIPSKNAIRLHHNFFDPSKVKGTEEKRHEAFLRARAEIKEYFKRFVEEYQLA